MLAGDTPHPVAGRGGLDADHDSRRAGHTAIRRRLRIGAAVRLMARPIPERLAILDDLDDTGRVRVLLDVLGRPVAVSTQADDLVPLP